MNIIKRLTDAVRRFIYIDPQQTPFPEDFLQRAKAAGANLPPHLREGSLAASGHIITDSTGAIVGKVASVRLSPEELAQERRAGFRLVKTEE